MSYQNDTSCVTCEARNEKCDATKGTAGCRKCAQAGLKCEGYFPSGSSTLKPKRSARNIDMTCQDHSQLINPNEILEEMTSPIGPPVLNFPSASVRNNPAIASADRYDLYALHYSVTSGPGESSTNLPSHGFVPSQIPTLPAGNFHTSSANQIIIPTGQAPVLNEPAATNENHYSWEQSNSLATTPQQYTDLHSHVIPHAQISTASTPIARTPIHPNPQFMTPDAQLQLPTPPIESSAPWTFAGESMTTPYQANRIHPTYRPANDAHNLPLTPRSPGLRTVRGSNSQVQAELAGNWPFNDPEGDIDEDIENIQESLQDVLVLDREVESNTVTFVLDAFVSWMIRFLFEPTRVIPLVKESIVRGYTSGPEAHHRMLLIANTLSAVSKSTDYDVDLFMALYSAVSKDVAGARAQSNLTREMAVAAMESSYELITIACKICSLASVLNMMDFYAPVFRRACPESGEELVNLPKALIAIEIHLKLFATLDVLLSVITSRPMFFRYNLEFSSPREEDLLNSEDSPGLRWLYGVPDRLVVTLARINTLYEGFGNSVDRETVRDLEKEIAACALVVSSVTLDPVLKLGRMVVQECWRLVASVYLYMGLCGADSEDARVTKVQKKFMSVIGGVKPCRNPDSFLVFPMMVVGVATPSPTDQSALLNRIWGVSECNKQGTLGNDIIRILNDIWARTTERPAVWSDLRMACLGVMI
ncbi:fungal-specific transcription factor domain protein [Rhizoctonia solani 123E]|uniref:Fungal-specific transcription factor domain protein n=1 Tax=Rhizoctonia solani 123E TaxID=1423351 RepID=A0A074RX94_9AGAM|nr:fungal-specific transcription factor domain protein [Rhizoctonia solani 123E]